MHFHVNVSTACRLNYDRSCYRARAAAAQHPLGPTDDGSSGIGGAMMPPCERQQGEDQHAFEGELAITLEDLAEYAIMAQRELELLTLVLRQQHDVGPMHAQPMEVVRTLGLSAAVAAIAAEASLMSAEGEGGSQGSNGNRRVSNIANDPTASNALLYSADAILANAGR